MSNGNPIDDDPEHTIIIVGENKNYKILRHQWENDENKLSPVEEGVVNQLTKFGAYLSFAPTDEPIGVGSVCTIVNLRSILRNQGKLNKDK